MDAIGGYQVVIIPGDKGCGKSTQVQGSKQSLFSIILFTELIVQQYQVMCGQFSMSPKQTLFMINPPSLHAP